MPTIPPFANHIHVFPPKMGPNDLDGTPEAFAEIAAQLGIGGGVFFAPFTYQWPGGDPNGWLARQLRRFPDYVGYGTLDPQKPARDQVARIEDLGLRGVKIHGPAQHFPLNCDWIMDAYEQMERMGLVADFHLAVHGYRLKDYHPLLLDEVAHRFPGLRMVFEHVGGWHFVRDTVAVIANHQFDGDHRFLYAGVATVLDREHMPGWYLGPEGVADVAWQIGADRLIYGTDFPYNGRERLAADLAIIAQMSLSADDRAALLGENLRELLGLDR
jgi:predicted TIM-barrel fold metal-dependent hydrolase